MNSPEGGGAMERGMLMYLENLFWLIGVVKGSRRRRSVS